MTASASSNFGSTSGHPASATHGLCPRISHISSAVNGATNESEIAIASAASRTAGSAGPQPESIALRVAFTNSITRATATLNLNDSTAKPTSCSALCVTFRSARSPLEKSAPAGLVTSPEIRQARFKNLTEPDGETSDQ